MVELERQKITNGEQIKAGNLYDLAFRGRSKKLLSNSYLGEYNANKESAKGISDKLGSVTVIVYELK